jgi:hypothetical protein
MPLLPTEERSEVIFAAKLLRFGSDGKPTNRDAVVARLVKDQGLTTAIATSSTRAAIRQLSKKTVQSSAKESRRMRRTVMLSDKIIRRLTTLGDGDLSEGIRRLVDEAGL